MCVRRRVILLDHTRTRNERRCDLGHALAHIELGHTNRRSKSDEEAAKRYAAKMLIDLEQLGDALERSLGKVTDEAADDLEVDVETLTIRLQHLHPGEYGYLKRRLAFLAEASA